MSETDAKQRPEEGSQMGLLDHLKLLKTLFTRGDLLRYLALAGLQMFGAVLDTLGIGLIPVFIGVLASPDALAKLPLVGDWLNACVGGSAEKAFSLGGGLLVGVFVTKTLYFLWLHNLQMGMIAEHRVNISQRLFSCYMNAPWTFHLQRNSSELMRKVVVETGEIIKGVMLPLLTVMLGIILSCFLIVLMVAALPWQCITVFLVLGLCCGVLMRAFNLRSTAAGRDAKAAGRRCVQAVNEGLGMIIEARVLGREPYVTGRYHTHITRFAQAERFRDYVRMVFPYIVEAVVVVGIIVIFFFLVRTGGSFQEVIPQVALIGAVALRLRQSASQVFAGLVQVHFSRPVIEHIVEDIRHLEAGVRPSASGSLDAAAARPFAKRLCFDEVSFTYPETERPSLQGLSFSIAAGESVAFVGSTGSGKSTIINLLLGLLDPGSGGVTVDGTPIQENVGHWQRQIGYVPQTIHLMDDTVRRNIAFGVPDDEVDEARVREVISQAQLGPTIEGMQDGLDTVVGERGVRISGGQRQRLGIARALYHRPTVLVMDEGTAALDTATEASLVRCLRTLEGKMTMVFVAHRLSTIEHCQRIFFLQEGRLLGAGTHEELMRDLPAYRAMHQLGGNAAEGA